jgi:hypothetical protein
MEYSVWTWRWTKSPREAADADPDDMGGEALLSGSCAVRFRRSGRLTHGLDGPAGGRTPAYATTPLILAGLTDTQARLTTYVGTGVGSAPGESLEAA